jgi:predicted secreted hydrolase
MKRVALLMAALLGTAAAAPPVRLDADGFRLAVPGWRYEFPQDHAAHPSFRIEWWYYTGHLRSGARTFGYEATFFRVALPWWSPAGEASAWRARHVLFRHLALTDEAGRRFLFDDRAERQALDLAGADSTRYLTWLGDDYVGLEQDRRTHRVVGRAAEFALDLRLVPEKPPVVHGPDGVSRKSEGEGQASHYYSLTRLATRGRLVRGRDTLAVEGRSWMDHEWSSSRLRDTHAGWDWFSIQLSDGRDLMLYRLRRKTGEDEPVSSGTLVAADGAARHLAREAFEIRATGSWKSPESGGRYPSGWIVRVPSAGLELTLEPVLADQELRVTSMNGIVYWEGRVRVRGTSAGRAVTGEGYVELTGYAGPAPG